MWYLCPELTRRWIEGLIVKAMNKLDMRDAKMVKTGPAFNLKLRFSGPLGGVDVDLVPSV